MNNRTLLALVLTAAALVYGAAPAAQGQTFCVPPSTPPSPPPAEEPPTVCEPQECGCCYGSPCHIGQGTYVNRFFDFGVNTASFPLQVGRRYVSSRSVDGPNGVGWTTSLIPRVYHAAYLLTAPGTYSYEARVMLPDGVVYKYTSAGGGNYTPPGGRTDKLVRNADGSWDLTVGDTRTVLHFDSNGAAQTLIDEYGNEIGWVYDTNGRLLKIEDRAGSGRYLEVTWGSDGRVASVTARSTSSPSTAYKSVQYTYDTDGTLATVVNPAGHITRYTYTPGRFAPLLNQVRDHWNRIVTSLTYDSSERLTGYTDGDPAWGGEQFTYAHYPQSNLAVKTAAGTGSQPFNYTTNGFPSGDGVHRDVSTGRIIQDTSSGATKQYTYDAQGRLTIALIYVTGYWPVAFRYSYDTTWPARLSAIEAFTDNSLSTRDLNYQARYYTYYGPTENGAGQLKEVEVLRSDGTTRDVVLRYAYDNRGRMISEEEVGAGPATTYAYTAAGDLHTESNNGTITYGYDAIGRRTSVTDRTGATTSYEYDALDRVTAVTLPAPYSGAPLFRATLSYDHFDSVKNLLFVHKSDFNGRVTRTGYDVMRNLVEHIDTLGNLTRYTHTNNLLTRITDANGNETTYTYDWKRRLSKTIQADGTYEQLWYGSNDKVSARRNRAGITYSYAYDMFDRLISTSWADNQKMVEYTYAGAKLNEIKYYDGTAWQTNTYTYDSSYRLLTEAQGNRGKITLAYAPGNPSERLTSVTVESATGVPGSPMSVSYTNYDAAGRPTQMYWPGAGYFNVAYNANDQYTSISDPWGNSREFQYDGQGRLTSVVNKRHGSTLASFTYGYDYDWATGTNTMLGQRTSTTVAALASLNQYSGQTRYFYDNRYQLTRSEWGTQADTWSYDAIGNRLTENGYTYGYYTNALGNNTDRLKHINGSSAVMQYDSRGNLTADPGVNVEYVWDDENRLLKRKTPGQNNPVGTWYEYDGLSRRVVREWALEKYAVLYLGMHAVSERRMSSQLGRTDQVDYLFAPGLDLPIAEKNQNGSTFYLSDGLGSIIGKIDSTGQVSEGTGYAPFGLPNANWPYFAFTGRETADNFLYYYRGRYYNPAYGRFLSEDPAETYYRNMVGRSSYAYVENSPIDSTDPTGFACLGGQSCQNGLSVGPWIVFDTLWGQDWFKIGSEKPGPQAGANNFPPPNNKTVPANQYPAGGFPFPLQVCYWEKMHVYTDTLARDVTEYRACQCPQSYTILHSWTETKTRTRRYQMTPRVIYKTVGMWVPFLPPAPCTHPSKMGM